MALGAALTMISLQIGCTRQEPAIEPGDRGLWFFADCRGDTNLLTGDQVLHEVVVFDVADVDDEELTRAWSRAGVPTDEPIGLACDQWQDTMLATVEGREVRLAAFPKILTLHGHPARLRLSGENDMVLHTTRSADGSNVELCTRRGAMSFCHSDSNVWAYYDTAAESVTFGRARTLRQ